MKFLSEFKWIILVYLLSMAAWTGYNKWQELVRPVAHTAPAVLFEIPKGSSFLAVAEQLQDRGLIRSKDVFYILAWYRKDLAKLKAGEYKLSPAMSPGEILDILVSGRTVRHLVTIPEGYNMFQIARLLDRGGLAKRDEFLKICTDKDFLLKSRLSEDSAEGYLFPESYFISKSSTPEEIASTFILQFWKVWKGNGFDKRAEEINSTMHEVVTLASIVELEAAVQEEKPIIASVFWNRLKKGIPLQADPTVKYGVLIERKIKKRRLTWKDLRKKTPYNTYTRYGLPKGPIANPGLESLRAVLYPKKTNYLYFVSKGNGRHYFSKTLKEHNRAVNKYIRHR